MRPQNTCVCVCVWIVVFKIILQIIVQEGYNLQFLDSCCNRTNNLFSKNFAINIQFRLNSILLAYLIVVYFYFEILGYYFETVLELSSCWHCICRPYLSASTHNKPIKYYDTVVIGSVFLASRIHGERDTVLVDTRRECDSSLGTMGQVLSAHYGQRWVRSAAG